MSFFLNETFTLTTGGFQTGINTDTEGNGTVYQDGTYGYIKTYTDTDTAFIYSDALSQAEYANTPLKFDISYQITTMADGDALTICGIRYKATAPVPGSEGDIIIYCYIRRGGANYLEVWRYYDSSGTAWYYNGTTNAWTNTSSDYVRVVSVSTTYTLTATYHNCGRKYTIANDAGKSGMTTTTRHGTTENIYWMIGESTTTYYGQMVVESMSIVNTRYRALFTLRNSLTGAYRKSPFLTIINNLTTRHRDSFTLKNNILDHVPYRDRFKLVNNIGIPGQLVYLDGSWQNANIKGKQFSNSATVEIDGDDVSDKITDWSIDYDDQVVAKTISVTVKDMAFAQSIRVRKSSDSDFLDARIEIIDYQGYSLGQYLIENKRESTRSGEYTCTLSGRSMTALLDKPFSQPLQTLYNEPTTKFAVASELAGEKSVEILWSIPDAILPAGALTCDDETPGKVISKMVEAGGGLVRTDREDNLVCDYKDYETVGKTPLMSLTSGDIVSVTTDRSIPDGENFVEVSGYEDLAVTGGWAKVTLSPSKMKLQSNGCDSCILTARCWNEDNSIPDVELIEEEEQAPARNDHYEISVSSMIDAEGAGVVEIKKKSDSSVVAGPYEILDDNRTIRVTTAMDDTDYLITYWGGETVAFSVNQYADVSPIEAIVREGKAQTTLRASAGGGGWAMCSVDYHDAQTAKANVQISDPRVGSINMTANPSTINVGGTSTVKIQVLDSEGYAAQNGLTVWLQVTDQYNEAAYTGNITPEQITTTTETITDGTPDSPVYSNNEITVTTDYPITSLTSVYRIIGRDIYKGTNYASGATVDGNIITLATPLPYPDTPLVITYTSTGMASATYIYPSSNSTPEEGRFNYIRGYCGEYGTCRVEIRGPQGSNTEPPTGTNKVYLITFAGTFTPGGNSNGRKSYYKEIHWISSDIEPDIRTVEAVVQIEGGTVAGWNITKFSNTGPTLVELLVQANSIFHSYDSQDIYGNVSGKRLVIDADTRKPVSNAEVYIDWSGQGTYSESADEGPLYTGIDGIFYFEKGKEGETHNIKITKSGYDDLTSTITIPGDVYEANAATSVYDACTFDIKVPVYNIIK